MKALFQKYPVLPFLLFSFIVASWPFINFPLTDGDISHWVGIAKEIQINTNFLTSAHDQAHGPLLPWTAGIFTKLSPESYYLFNLFNILVGVLGTFFAFFFSKRILKDEGVAKLAAFIFSTSLVHVYLSRTPMYDWPAAIFYSGFCGFYWLYLKENKTKHFIIALSLMALGTLNRFSITIGLSGIFLIGINLVMRRSLILLVRDGLLIWGVAIASNFPWLFKQTEVHGEAFLKEFLYDNFGRYIKEPGNSKVRVDFYGFPLYVLIGMLPHTFTLLASFFQRSFISKIKHSKNYIILLLGFLPCLILFSMSGHVKLGRYIAFVFPFLSILLAHSLYHHDLDTKKFKNRSKHLLTATFIGFAAILVMLGFQFTKELQEGLDLALMLIVMVVGLLAVARYGTVTNTDLLKHHSQKLLLPIGILYSLFFTLISYNYDKVSFLIKVNKMIQTALNL